MKHTIWATNNWMDIEKELKEENPNLSDSDAYSLAWENNMNQLEDEKLNLKDITGKNWFAIGDLVRWDGTRNVHRALKPGTIMDAITETMQAFGGAENTFEIYVEGCDVFLSQLGHDNPVNPSIMKIRQIKDEYIPKWNSFFDAEDVLYEAFQSGTLDSVSIGFGDKIAAVYGWNNEMEVES